MQEKRMCSAHKNVARRLKAFAGISSLDSLNTLGLGKNNPQNDLSPMKTLYGAFVLSERGTEPSPRYMSYV